MKIALLLNFEPSWMGGVIYLLNITRTLSFLPVQLRPKLTVFTRRELIPLASQFSDSHTQIVSHEFPRAHSAYPLSWIKRRNCFISPILDQGFDLAYPVQDFPVRTNSKTRLVAWYADLQHKHYPNFFSFRKRAEREFRIRQMLKHADGLVLSSQAVHDDFKTYYRLPKKLPIHLFRFATVLDEQLPCDTSSLLQKYNLPDDYFFVANQFHRHKNHETLLSALAKLTACGAKIDIAMTGRLPPDPTDPYLRRVNEIITTGRIAHRVHILGTIPRGDQLALMRNSIAVIQPSLFEGWSTVIEDALALGVPVIASDIPVNREQLGLDGCYFNPLDTESLAELLEAFTKQPPLRRQSDYPKRVLRSASQFLSIAESLTTH